MFYSFHLLGVQEGKIWPKEIESSIYSVRKKVINVNFLHLFTFCCCIHAITFSLKVLLNLLSDFLLQEKKCLF